MSFHALKSLTQCLGCEAGMRNYSLMSTVSVPIKVVQMDGGDACTTVSVNVLIITEL